MKKTFKPFTIVNRYWQAVIMIFCAFALSGCVVYPYDYPCCAYSPYSSDYPYSTYNYNYGWYGYPGPYVSGVFVYGSGNYHYHNDGWHGGGGGWSHGGGGGHGGPH
jgi:uncharacterized membrane protein YgcG